MFRIFPTFRSFGFVSNFEFRILDFLRAGIWCFEFSHRLGHSDLFRISNFGFRIFFSWRVRLIRSVAVSPGRCLLLWLAVPDGLPRRCFVPGSDFGPLRAHAVVGEAWLRSVSERRGAALRLRGRHARFIAGRAARPGVHDRHQSAGRNSGTGDVTRRYRGVDAPRRRARCAPGVDTRPTPVS